MNFLNAMPHPNYTPALLHSAHSDIFSKEKLLETARTLFKKTQPELTDEELSAIEWSDISTLPLSGSEVVALIE